ncbi:MAG: dioxygenase family protein [Sphingosinicella sp.]
MPRTIQISRRSFAAGAFATAGLAVAGRTLAHPTRTPTPESAMGPFYPVERPAESDADLTWLAGHSQRAAGTVIEVRGRVLDRRGNPLTGASLELWQCNAAGRYAHPNDPATAPLDPHFQGFAALTSDASGGWRIVTIKPGGYDSPIGHRPPHLHWDLRGARDRRVAQMYFPEDAEANAADSLYRALGAAAPLSVARAEASNIYHWDVVLDEG